MNTKLLTVNFDPLEKYTELPNQVLNEMLGYIPSFLCYRTEDQTVKEALTKAYGFGELHEMTGGTIKDMVYRYPEDPELYPLAEMTSRDTTVLQYQYGIVAILEPDGSVFVTRMD